MREFFDLCWGDLASRGLYGEIRAIHPKGVKAEFLTTADAAIGTALYYDALGWDAYFGVVPRIRAGGTAQDARSVTSVLWADVDDKRFGNRERAFWSISSAAIEPSILVDSGHGFHAYWLLDHEVAMNHASNAMRGIAKLIGGDAVADAARILRVPGTHNYKTEPAVPVRVLRLSDKRYRFSDFAPFAELADGLETFNGPSEIEQIRERPAVPVQFQELPEWLRELIEFGRPKGQRSEAAYKAMLWLIRYGWDQDGIYDLFVAFPEGIGAKLVEKGRDALRWFNVTYNAALAAAEVDD